MSRRPHILYMIADDHRHDAIAAAGDATVRTPTMDRLIAEGAHLRGARMMGGVHGAVCVPARACANTGRSVFKALECQAYSRTMHPTSDIKREHVTLGQAFRHAGYHTHGIGKWHNDKAAFNRSFGSGEAIFFGGMSDHLRCPVHRYDASGEYGPSTRRMGEKFSTDLFADAAVSFIDGYAEEAPFFMYLAFTSPHDPRMAPEPWASSYPRESIPLPPNFQTVHTFDHGEFQLRDEVLAGYPRSPGEIQQHIADYYAMIEHQDYHMGRVLAALEAKGILDDTIIVYTADHGLSVGQHGLMGKQTCYDHAIRVPCLMRGPGVPAGVGTDALTYAMDLYPTLGELTGVETPADLDGRSLVPVLTGKASGVRETSYSVYRDYAATVTDGEWKLIRNTVSRITGRGTNRLQLFHIADDKWELHDLANRPETAAIQARLLADLFRWQVEIQDPQHYA